MEFVIVSLLLVVEGLGIVNMCHYTSMLATNPILEAIADLDLVL